MKKRIFVAVSSDIATDQRVRKQCQSLTDAGFDVVLIGRLLPGSLPVVRDYKVVRLRLLFKRKAWFYAELNIRLFVLALFTRASLFYANDLDTLPACALASALKRKYLVYDSHEFFTGVPEIQNRKWVKSIWSFLERRFIKYCYIILTVNYSIANLLEDTYSVSNVYIVRNVPDPLFFEPSSTRMALDLPDDVPLLILQGSGINVQRGAEELVQAMEHLPDALLLIIGSGDAIAGLKEMARNRVLQSRVLFFPKMPYREMMQYTQVATLGLSLDKDTNINYRFSLPNKVFDYIQAGIPVLSSNLVELRNLIAGHNIGRVVDEVEPLSIASAIRDMLSDTEAMKEYRQNVLKLRKELSWETEYKPIVNEIIRLTHSDRPLGIKPV